jgi:hypothetical protein
MSALPTGREGARQLAMGRMGFGIAGLLFPRTFGRMWVGGDGRSPRVAAITRAFAIRDFALGLGVLLATERDAPVRGWIEAGLLCDTADLLATLVSPLPIVRKVAITSSAIVAAAGGALSLQGLGEPAAAA